MAPATPKTLHLREQRVAYLVWEHQCGPHIAALSTDRPKVTPTVVPVCREQQRHTPPNTRQYFMSPCLQTCCLPKSASALLAAKYPHNVALVTGFFPTLYARLTLGKT